MLNQKFPSKILSCLESELHSLLYCWPFVSSIYVKVILSSFCVVMFEHMWALVSTWKDIPMHGITHQWVNHSVINKRKAHPGVVASKWMMQDMRNWGKWCPNYRVPKWWRHGLLLQHSEVEAVGWSQALVSNRCDHRSPDCLKLFRTSFHVDEKLWLSVISPFGGRLPYVPPTKTRFKFIQIRNNEYQTHTLLYFVDPIQMRTATKNHHLTPKSRNIFQKARVHSYNTVSALFRQ